jgi:hypothetical protein
VGVVACGVSENRSRSRGLSWVRGIHRPMPLLCAYLGDCCPAAFGGWWAYGVDASWFEPSAFVCGSAAGRDAYIAVFAWVAWLALDLERSAAELASTG